MVPPSRGTKRRTGKCKYFSSGLGVLFGALLIAAGIAHGKSVRFEPKTGEANLPMDEHENSGNTFAARPLKK